MRLSSGTRSLISSPSATISISLFGYVWDRKHAIAFGIHCRRFRVILSAVTKGKPRVYLRDFHAFGLKRGLRLRHNHLRLIRDLRRFDLAGVTHPDENDRVGIVRLEGLTGDDAAIRSGKLLIGYEFHGMKMGERGARAGESSPSAPLLVFREYARRRLPASRKSLLFRLRRGQLRAVPDQVCLPCLRDKLLAVPELRRLAGLSVEIHPTNGIAQSGR